MTKDDEQMSEEEYIEELEEDGVSVGEITREGTHEIHVPEHTSVVSVSANGEVIKQVEVN